LQQPVQGAAAQEATQGETQVRRAAGSLARVAALRKSTNGGTARPASTDISTKES